MKSREHWYVDVGDGNTLEHYCYGYKPILRAIIVDLRGCAQYGNARYIAGNKREQIVQAYLEVRDRIANSTWLSGSWQRGKLSDCVTRADTRSSSPIRNRVSAFLAWSSAEWVPPPRASPCSSCNYNNCLAIFRGFA